jgi:hypothetical protein
MLLFKKISFYVWMKSDPYPFCVWMRSDPHSPPEQVMDGCKGHWLCLVMSSRLLRLPKIAPNPLASRLF